VRFLKEAKEKNELLEWIKVIAFTCLLVIGIQYFLFTPVVVDGKSMMPTLENRDKVIVNKIEPRLTEYDRFDVIVFEARENTYYIKRIIGLPGDQIVYKDDVLYVNGKAYDEPYLDAYKAKLKGSSMLNWDFTLDEILGEKVVPKGYYFVLGDNRQDSFDSRYPSVGFISKEKILGKADLVFYPFENVKSLRK